VQPSEPQPNRGQARAGVRPAGPTLDFSFDRGTLRDVSDPIPVSREVVVPREAIRMRAVRSSGPGGQNVNKVSSKVELRIDIDAIRGLSPAARGRLHAIIGTRRDAEGHLVVTSQLTRDRSQNLEDARVKVRRLIERCLVEPRKRRATRPHTAARERRLAAKRLLGDRKRGRGRVPSDE
jgi:ribosome-associated protein